MTVALVPCLFLSWGPKRKNKEGTSAKFIVPCYFFLEPIGIIKILLQLFGGATDWMIKPINFSYDYFIMLSG